MGEDDKCYSCGAQEFEERHINYLYSHKGKYLLVPDTPVEVCASCGMMYCGAVIEDIEEQFFAIHDDRAKTDNYISVPVKAYTNFQN